MTYEEAIKYLYEATPVFQEQGAGAYKPGLERVELMDQKFGSPHRNYTCIHVAGTNGKGSTSHTLAAILQLAGYKVGLFTSPHLVSFRERIRVNGRMIDEGFVADFTDRSRELVEDLAPSFFELTSMMAFDYFSHCQVDIAVIEVGMGGRLDSTNIINPILSIITNISLDHTQFLGDSLAKIAYEKAGIIKPGVPVVIGAANNEVRNVILDKARSVASPICWAEESEELIESTAQGVHYRYTTKTYGTIEAVLGSKAQPLNARCVLAAIPYICEQGFAIGVEAVRAGFAQLVELTGLQGRWQQIYTEPRVICDTGHNVDGISLLMEQLKSENYKQLHMVFGMVNDKDISGVLKLLPTDAIYYFTQADIERALGAEQLAEQARPLGLLGNSYPNVPQALQAALDAAHPDDFIFVGGSSFIVADLLKNISKTNQ